MLYYWVMIPYLEIEIKHLDNGMNLICMYTITIWDSNNHPIKKKSFVIRIQLKKWKIITKLNNEWTIPYKKRKINEN